MTRTPAALPARDRYRSAADLAAVEPRPLPPLGSDERVGLPAPVWRSLPCGLRAVAVHDPHAATVEVQLLLPYTPATQRESALADLLADAVLRGAEHELRAGRTAEWFIVTAHAPSDELAGLLQDLTLAFTGGSTPGDPVARARARLARRAHAANAHPATTARDALQRMRFGPLGCFAGLPAPDAIAALTTADVEAARREMLRLHGAHLVIVGDIASERAMDLAEEAFAECPTGEGTQAAAPSAPAAGGPPARKTVHRPGALQSHFLMAFPAEAPAHDDYPALALAHTVFAGYFSSRLVLRIREGLGLTCHVASSFDRTLGTHGILLEGSCATADTETVLAEVGDEWARTATRPFTPSEVENARRHQLGMLAALRASPAALAQFLSTLCCWDIPLDWTDHYATHLRTVSRARVAEAARTYLSPGPTASVVVGDATVLTPELRGDEPR
ncbi:MULTISPECIES: M16 family metallopeptidase [Streptomyces]|uniref:M16 family metallopeptidase n=1 Tax=Streptomyces fimbriatus TaxID=68197 RepID=A0ABW0D5W9_STRFI